MFMQLPSRKIIKELLQDPFGPYHDQDVLSAQCQSKAGQMLVLNSFQVANNDQIVGLDDSEKPLGTGEIDNRVYRFRGILSILSPIWLSPVGAQRVEAELNLRAHTRSMREGERPPREMTLEELFHRSNRYLGRKDLVRDGDELELRLKIQGFKSMSALYMRAKEVPHGLLWVSKDRDRHYEVVTMDVYTYQRSENFFWRYHLLDLMTKIVEQDPQRTPLDKRTPEWFVSQYIQRFAHPPGDRHKRLIYDSDDPDVNDDGITCLPRHPRRIHRSDVRGLFAAQSEWLVTDNEVKRHKLFPFGPWNQFRKMVRKARSQAGRNNVTWGFPIGREHDPDLESDPDREDEEDDDDYDTRNMVRRNPTIGKTNEAMRRKINKAKTKRNLPSARRIVISPSSSSDESNLGTAHAYVSDFSEESSVAASDSDDSGDAHLREFAELIPPEFFEPPELPGPDNRWWCRVPDCDYLIDMQHLQEENVQGLQGDSVFYLMVNRCRNIRDDERAQAYFFEMVSMHRKDHLARLGLEPIVRNGPRGRVAGVGWIKHRRRDSDICGQQGAVIVKEEDIQ